MSILVLPLAVAGFALFLLIWSIFKIAGHMSRHQPPRLKHCVALFGALTIADLLVCAYIFFVSSSHSFRGGDRENFLECLLSFVLLVVTPTAVVLIYRYHRVLKADEARASGQAVSVGVPQQVVATAGITTAVIVTIVCLLVAQAIGWPPLMYAVRHNYPRIAEWLLDMGGNVDSRDRYGRTPLTYFIMRGDVPKAKELLERGANVNYDGGSGTPLTWAVMYRRVGLAGVLLDHGADLHARHGGMSPLMRAAGNRHVEMVKLLLDRGADINASSAYGTALSRASQSNALHVVRLLLERGANPNLASKRGRTPLMEASWRGHMDVVRELLAHGADVNARTGRGETALKLATKWRKKKVRELLLQHGATE